MPLVLVEPTELAALVKNAVHNAFEEFNERQNQIKVMDSSQVCELLGIGSVTLWQYGKDRKLIPIEGTTGKGSHRKYRYIDIMEFINKRKK